MKAVDIIIYIILIALVLFQCYVMLSYQKILEREIGKQNHICYVSEKHVNSVRVVTNDTLYIFRFGE